MKLSFVTVDMYIIGLWDLQIIAFSFYLHFKQHPNLFDIGVIDHMTHVICQQNSAFIKKCSPWTQVSFCKRSEIFCSNGLSFQNCAWVKKYKYCHTKVIYFCSMIPNIHCMLFKKNSKVTIHDFQMIYIIFHSNLNARLKNLVSTESFKSWNGLCFYPHYCWLKGSKI